jgi:hypothetical protein
MAKFTTRVELYGKPTWDDYDKLHTAMEAEGFSRIIADSDGKEYHMPHAEYNREAELNRSQILSSAKKAAASVWEDFGVLVTESDGRTWHNLKPT